MITREGKKKPELGPGRSAEAGGWPDDKGLTGATVWDGICRLVLMKMGPKREPGLWSRLCCICEKVGSREPLRKTERKLGRTLKE